MKTVCISVIIPVFNAGKTLGACLDSVLEQGFGSFEVIVVDDGSTDGSPALACEYARRDARVRLIRQKHGGASSARNRGMRAARGRYILFADSDDALADGALAILWHAADAQKLDIVRCDLFREDAGILRADSRGARLPRGVMTGPAFFSAALARDAYRCHVGAGLFSRSMLLQNGVWFYEGIICEDELFTPQALLAARRVRHVPHCLYRHVMREGSVMRSTDRRTRGESLLTVAYALEGMLPRVPESCRRAWKRNMLGKYFCGYTIARMYRPQFRGRRSSAFAFRHACCAKDRLRACVCALNGRLFCALNAAGMWANRRRGVVRS